MQKKGRFTPELLNRFDDIIVFKPLGIEDITKIAQMLLNSFVKKLAEKDIDIRFDRSILEKIVREGFSQEFGARPIRRYIQDNIENLLAQKMLKGEIKKGSKATVSVDNMSNIIAIEF